MTFKRTYRRKHLFYPKDVYPSYMNVRAWLTDQMMAGYDLPKDHYQIEITACNLIQDARKKERLLKTLSDVTGRVYVCAW